MATDAILWVLNRGNIAIILDPKDGKEKDPGYEVGMIGNHFVPVSELGLLPFLQPSKLLNQV